MTFFIYVFNLLFKSFLKQEHTTQVSGQAMKNFDLLALSMSLFLVCIGLLQPLPDIVMPVHLRSFLDALYLALIVLYVPQGQQIGGNGKWRRKGKQYMQYFFPES